MKASEMIAAYDLRPHPEGGWYREVHRSAQTLGTPVGFPGCRVAATAIYFLLADGDFSAFHRVRGEEFWLHLAGAALELVLLAEAPTVRRLGPVGAEGTAPLAVVPSGVLQAARSTGEWTLVSCIVAPGFEFEDFEMPGRRELELAYPAHVELVRRFTRERAG